MLGPSRHSGRVRTLFQLSVVLVAGLMDHWQFVNWSRFFAGFRETVRWLVKM